MTLRVGVQGGHMYKVCVIGVNKTEFRVKTENYEFMIDSDGEKGITPPDTLLAGLASCMGVYIRKYCKNTSIEIKEFEITLQAELSEEKPVSFRKIEAKIDLKGAQFDEMRKRSIISFIKNCPVHNTLKNSPEIITEII
jgi:uncharacterized OsmC-like protein